MAGTVSLSQQRSFADALDAQFEPSDGFGGEAVTLVVESWYYTNDLGWYLGNGGSSQDGKTRHEVLHANCYVCGVTIPAGVHICAPGVGYPNGDAVHFAMNGSPVVSPFV